MARSALIDHLSNYAFWLYDIAPIDPLGVPVLSPFLGFQACSAPQIEVEVTEVNEANWYFATAVIKSAKVSNITLARGATFSDSDFWRWMQATLAGDVAGFKSKSYGTGLALGAASSGIPIGGLGTAGGAASAGAPLGANVVSRALDAGDVDFSFPAVGGFTYRRDLLLIQFLSKSPLPPGANEIVGGALGGSLLGGAGDQFNVTATGVGAAGVVTGALNASGATNLTHTNGENTPFHRLPAKAWILRGCVPVRYKASSDFDATNSEVALQELELAVDILEEISLSG